MREKETASTLALYPQRTAVLVVHGMGSQRPLETTRGVVKAVWLQNDQSSKRRLWTHPEKSGVDIDLTVFTTNVAAGVNERPVDFHELYWAHLMSETRAVAVLLWLCELARKGPRLKPEIGVLYWGVLVFLALLVLSASLLALQLLFHVLEWVGPIADDRHSLVFVLLLAALVASGAMVLIAALQKASRLAAYVASVSGATAIALWVMIHLELIALAEPVTSFLMPIGLAATIITLSMGYWGLAGLALVLGLSAVGLTVGLVLFWTKGPFPYDWIPWNVSSLWSAELAWIMIAIYGLAYALFLQPYLGDAARYFRDSPGNVAVRREIRKQAVDTLEALHLSGDYERIIVVAHSLGTVIAYDMLRAYYSRINRALPDPGLLGPDFAMVDDGSLPKETARAIGRDVIKKMAGHVHAAQQRVKNGTALPGDADLRAWLVTDFVTLGSPLTHAYYLMCKGGTLSLLKNDFKDRTREREFPTSPPLILDGDQRLTFLDRDVRRFHHGGQFALTRWTNLFFPASELLWGDAIGGPVAEIFGDPDHGANVIDVPVFTNTAEHTHFFAHVLYWNSECSPEGFAAPHILALQNAIDIGDEGLANAAPKPSAGRTGRKRR
jgi:hypothetical protein